MHNRWIFLLHFLSRSKISGRLLFKKYLGHLPQSTIPRQIEESEWREERDTMQNFELKTFSAFVVFLTPP